MRSTLFKIAFVAALAAIGGLAVVLLQTRDDLVGARLRLEDSQRSAAQFREELGECRTPPPVEPFHLAFVGVGGREFGLPVPEQRNVDGVLQRQHTLQVGRFECIFTYRWDTDIDGYAVFVDCTAPDGEELSSYGEVLASSPTSRVGLRRQGEGILWDMTIRRARRDGE
ncbi:MAG: hypothetical protein AAGH15_01155 [Myxococcota bacterium]